MQNVALGHQIKIAKKTLLLTDLGASILGGMTKEEARILLNKHGLRRNSKKKDPKKCQ